MYDDAELHAEIEQHRAAVFGADAVVALARDRGSAVTATCGRAGASLRTPNIAWY